MVAQKFKILSKRTVRGSALFTISDTKQGFTVPRGKQRCMKNGQCNICIFLYLFIVIVFTTKLFLSPRHDFFYSIHFEKFSSRNTRLMKKIILIQIKLSLTTTNKRGNLEHVWDKPVPDGWLCFCPNFLSFCWSNLVAFGEFTFKKHVTNQLFGLDFCAVQQVSFCAHQVYEQFIFYKKSSLYFIGWSFRNWKVATLLQLAKNWNIWAKVWQNLLFLSTFPTSVRCYAIGNGKSRVCAWSKLWIYSFFKKQWYKVLVIFWRYLWRDLQFKGLCWHCPARRHRGLGTIYIKHNIFHQSKLGRGAELQNTHIFLFKSPRDVMQVTTLSTQLGFDSELVNWYRDATSVPLGQLLIDLSLRTDNRLRFCSNTGSIPSKFIIPDRLKQSKNLDDEYTKSLYSPCVPIIFPQMQKSLPSVLPKRTYPVSMRIHNISAQRKPAKHKKTSHGKISKQASTIVSKTYNLVAKERHSGVRKRLTAH